MAELSTEAKKIISEFGPALIATASKEGKPNVSPKGSFRVLDDEHVIFANIASPRTIANLKENPQLTAIMLDRSGRKMEVQLAVLHGELTLSSFALSDFGDTRFKEPLTIRTGEQATFTVGR